jgi:hypothetical protein
MEGYARAEGGMEGLQGLKTLLYCRTLHAALTIFCCKKWYLCCNATWFAYFAT